MHDAKLTGTKGQVTGINPVGGRGDTTNPVRRESGIMRLGDAELADAIVAKICRVTRDRTLQHALEIGEIVAQGAYEGSLKAVAAQGQGHPVYSRIATHPALPFTPKHLWICVKIHELLQLHPRFRSSHHLGVAHLRAVLNLPAPVQERLLVSADGEAWTSEELEHAASNFRRKTRNQGRTRTAVLCRAITGIEKVAKELHGKLARSVRVDLAEQSVFVARESLQRARQHLDAIESELTRLTSEANVGAPAGPAKPVLVRDE